MGYCYHHYTLRILLIHVYLAANCINQIEMSKIRFLHCIATMFYLGYGEKMEQAVLQKKRVNSCLSVKANFQQETTKVKKLLRR